MGNLSPLLDLIYRIRTGRRWVISGALVLAALDAIGPVIRSSLLEVLPAEDGADGLCRPRVAGAGEMTASDRSGDEEW